MKYRASVFGGVVGAAVTAGFVAVGAPACGSADEPESPVAAAAEQAKSGSSGSSSSGGGTSSVTGTWKLDSSPSVTSSNTSLTINNTLRGIQAISASNVWAVGWNN